ncbi:MAG: hypothetical protein RDU76_04835 [Candidatus Edwardsbacteria bacterium]|nr:hypothetical protein [Candidatus Edwardsbacteria bacterium]
MSILDKTPYVIEILCCVLWFEGYDDSLDPAFKDQRISFGKFLLTVRPGLSSGNISEPSRPFSALLDIAYGPGLICHKFEGRHKAHLPNGGCHLVGRC